MPSLPGTFTSPKDINASTRTLSNYQLHDILFYFNNRSTKQLTPQFHYRSPTQSTTQPGPSQPARPAYCATPNQRSAVSLNLPLFLVPSRNACFQRPIPHERDFASRERDCLPNLGSLSPNCLPRFAPPDVVILASDRRRQEIDN